MKIDNSSIANTYAALSQPTGAQASKTQISAEMPAGSSVEETTVQLSQTARDLYKASAAGDGAKTLSAGGTTLPPIPSSPTVSPLSAGGTTLPPIPASPTTVAPLSAGGTTLPPIPQK